MNKKLLIAFCAALFSVVLMTADLALARGGSQGGGQGGCGYGSGTRAGQRERLGKRKRDRSCTQFEQTRSQTRQTIEEKDRTGQEKPTNQGTETEPSSDQSTPTEGSGAKP